MEGAFMRRIGIGAAGVATVALVLTACSGTTDNGGDAPQLSDEPVTIGITWWGGDARAEQTQQVIAAFEDKYPNITVEPQYSDWSGYWDSLATSAAAGDAPDVIQMDELYLASYGARGALYDTTQLDIDTSEFAPEALAAGEVGGTQYALPIGVGLYTFFANADLFEQYGVELPDDDTWTWDDYAAISKELTDKSGGAINGSTIVAGWDAGGLKYWARSQGNEVFDAEGEVTLDPDVLADMWDYQLDMIADGGMQSAEGIVESVSAGLSAGAFATGEVALTAGGHTQIEAYSTACGCDVRLLKLPEPEGVHPNFLKPSMYWAVSSQSEHPAEAALLVDFLLNSEEAAEIIKTERGMPASAATLALIADSLPETGQRAVEYQDRVTPGDAPAVTPNGGSGIEAILQRYTQEVFSGQTTSTAAAEAFIAELQGEINAAQ